MRKSKLASICLYSVLAIILLETVVLVTSIRKIFNLELLSETILLLYKPILAISVILLIASIVSLVRILRSQNQLKGIAKSIIAIILSVILGICAIFHGVAADGYFATMDYVDEILEQESMDETSDQEAEEDYWEEVEDEYKDDHEYEDEEENGFVDEWGLHRMLYEEKMRTSTIPEGPNELLKARWGATVEEVLEAEADKDFEEIMTDNSHYLCHAEQIDDVWVGVKYYHFDEEGKLYSLYIEYKNTFSYDEELEEFVSKDEEDWSPEGAYKHYTYIKDKLTELYGEPIYDPGGEINFYDDEISVETIGDEAEWDSLIGTGKITLSCSFAAMDTDIHLMAADSSIASFLVPGQLSIMCHIKQAEYEY